MYKAFISRNGQITHSSQVFKYREECQKWVEEQNFDLTPKQISRTKALELGLNFSELTPIIEDSMGHQIVYYMFPAADSLEIRDVTNEIQLENEAQESKEAIELKNSLQAEIRALNKRKLRYGEWDQSKFIAFIQSPLIKDLERALSQASFGTYIMLAANATEFYSPAEINQITSKVSAHVQKWKAKGVC